jgi:hypothetical protein
MPTSVTARNVLRRYTCAGAGLEDDLTASDKTHTLDFLPGGAPDPDEPDRCRCLCGRVWSSTAQPPVLRGRPACRRWCAPGGHPAAWIVETMRHAGPAQVIEDGDTPAKSSPWALREAAIEMRIDMRPGHGTVGRGSSGPSQPAAR